MEDTQNKRSEMVSCLFPKGIPALWCPPIVHYDENGKLDQERSRKHLNRLVRSVHTFLLSGSTGDGWELSGEEKKELLGFYMDEAERLPFQMLIGVLEPEEGAAAVKIKEWAEYLMRKAETKTPADAMRKCHICGFTVCAPRGAERKQREIRNELEKILMLDYPTVIYQLPQITENEISPETTAFLAEKYPNFYMFKDTSGTDRVKRSEKSYGNVFFVRGAEGDYERWSRFSGGCYDGFLLSSANTFGDELLAVLEALQEGRIKEAEAVSSMVSGIIGDVFEALQSLEGGNVFANANKCIDHILAYGKQWETYKGPMRHCGMRIPEEYLKKTYDILEKAGKVPEKGYCE